MSLVNSTSNTKIPTQDTLNDDENDSPEVKNSKRWSNQEPRPAKEHADDSGPVLLPLRGEIAK
jgi:hypothetical protein